MKVFISLLILMFSLQSLTKADDIRDFEIEGMSVGDSALNFVDKITLDSNKSYMWEDKKYEGKAVKLSEDKDKKIITLAQGEKTPRLVLNMAKDELIGWTNYCQDFRFHLVGMNLLNNY